MITKGTSEYKKAQELANELVRVANYTRKNDNTLYNMAFDPFYSFISRIKDLNVFASKIADTIDSKCEVFGYKIANVSEKQAWILACAAIENNIVLNY